MAYIGLKPYIIDSVKDKSANPGGSDIETLKLLAKHFGFRYSLQRAATFDWRRFKNGTSYGITYRVSE